MTCLQSISICQPIETLDISYGIGWFHGQSLSVLIQIKVERVATSENVDLAVTSLTLRENKNVCFASRFVLSHFFPRQRPLSPIRLCPSRERERERELLQGTIFHNMLREGLFTSGEVSGSMGHQICLAINFSMINVLPTLLRPSSWTLAFHIWEWFLPILKLTSGGQWGPDLVEKEENISDEASWNPFSLSFNWKCLAQCIIFLRELIQ